MSRICPVELALAAVTEGFPEEVGLDVPRMERFWADAQGAGGVLGVKRRSRNGWALSGTG